MSDTNNDNDNDNDNVLAQACAEALYQRDRAAQALGVSITQVSADRAEMTMTVRDDMLNGHDCCHGGYLFALADTAFAYACNSRNETTLAQGAMIDFLAPARRGDVLTARAESRGRSGRTGVFDVTVINQDEVTIAQFRGKSYRVKGTVLASAD